MPRDDKTAALASLGAQSSTVLLREAEVLSLAQCAVLCASLRSSKGGEADTVDGRPAFQLDLTRQKLESLVGAEAVARLWALPRKLSPSAPSRFTQVRLFARKYSPTTRPGLGCHCDSSDWTVNIALTDDEAHTGGRLRMWHGNGVDETPRRAGDATAHVWSVAHEVTPVTRGERASLIIFFFHTRQPH